VQAEDHAWWEQEPSRIGSKMLPDELLSKLAYFKDKILSAIRL
jgi:hypothetical protein